MFNWICGLGMIWGMIITGVGVIVGMAISLVALCFVVRWIGDLWNMLPYRVVGVMEKIGTVIKIVFITLCVLAGLFAMTLIAYAGICGL